MRVAVLSESSADEAAIRLIINSILGIETQTVSLPPLRTRGWPSVIRVFPSVLSHLYYQTDADALAVVVDSDDSPLHQRTHDGIGSEDMLCRLCQIRKAAAAKLSELRPVLDREKVKTAIGLAAPAIEAWYLCGVDPQVNEATWARRLQGESLTYTRKSLKRIVYGTERPSIEIETKFAIDASHRLSKDISLLERLFPDGFGALARDVRNW